VAVGEVLDWDIPNYDSVHAASDNESDWDGARNLIYQYTCWNDECDALIPADRAGGIAPYAGDDPWKNYMTLENDVYVYTSGPYGYDAPLPDSAIYDLMTETDGHETASLDSCEDLFTLVTFDVYDLDPHDTMCVVKILTTSKEDPDVSVLKANVDKANAFVDAHEEIQWNPGPGPCLCRPGDANGDGECNTGDAVYMIHAVLCPPPSVPPCPPPTPYPICSGDANCDGQFNLGDARFVICYVFCFPDCGYPPCPSPCTCEEWVAAHGWYE
jgi:hypothetical protein